MNQWDGIDEFVAVASQRSFSKAADQLGLSRTHMSRAIATLEDRVQARLFNRTTRTVILTATGEIFLEHCKRLVADRDEALAVVGAEGEPHGELHVTCSIALGERFVAPMTRQFALRHPKLKITLDLTNRVVDLLTEGFDLAVRTGHLTTSSQVATRIAERRMFTCAAPAYLARAGAPIRVADLARHECLVGSSALWHFRVNGTEQIVRPHGHWRCNSGQAVLDAALQGMGVCQLPDYYLHEALRSGALVPLLVDFTPPTEPIWAVYPSRRHLSPKVSRFVTLLRQQLPKALLSSSPV
jgi:DNA-binding transcriptional LysR family regulator